MTTPSKRVLPIRFTARLIECSDQCELATFASECPRANETLSRRFWRGPAAHAGSRLGEAFLDLAGRETVELTIPDGAHIRGDLCQMQRLVLGLKAEPCNQVRRDGNDFFPSRIKEWQAHCVTSCEAGGRARQELRLVQDEANNGGRAPQAACPHPHSRRPRPQRKRQVVSGDATRRRRHRPAAAWPDSERLRSSPKNACDG